MDTQRRVSDRPSDAQQGAGGVESFAGRGHAHWMVVAGANPREKGIHDAAFGHYGATVATVSFEHEYAHMPEYGAKMAADYADRLVACADAMKGIRDPRAFVAAAAELIAADKAYDEAWAAVCDADSDEAQIAADAALVAAHERRAAAIEACERAS